MLRHRHWCIVLGLGRMSARPQPGLPVIMVVLQRAMISACLLLDAAGHCQLLQLLLLALAAVHERRYACISSCRASNLSSYSNTLHAEHLLGAVTNRLRMIDAQLSVSLFGLSTFSISLFPCSSSSSSSSSSLYSPKEHSVTNSELDSRAGQHGSKKLH